MGKDEGLQAPSSRGHRPRYSRRLWAWMGMGQLANLLTVVFGTFASIAAANSSLVGYWWAMVIAAATTIFIPPVCYTPPGAIPPAAPRTIRVILESTLRMEAPSSIRHSPIMWVIWGFSIITGILGALRGLIGGLAGGGAIVGVIALAGPAVGGAVCAIVAGVAILRAVIN